MTQRVSTRLLAAFILVLGCTALLAGNASALTPEVAYNNLNTVPGTVNGHPDTDTYSQDFEGFPFGGMVETVNTNSRVIKTLTVQLDVFACEHGVYSLENCYTIHPSKKFTQEWTVDLYEVGAGNAEGALVASSTAIFRLPYRPTTETNCPATGEGKGYGLNCDVGGFLATVSFKHFTQSKPLPSKVIIVLTTPSRVPVNVGLQAAFKEYTGGNFVEEPAADGGVPAVGSDPQPAGAYFNGELQEPGWGGFQPVFELTVR
jgi:hypothetical protein